MKLISARAAGVLADSINDPDSTRKVYLLAAGLAALGVALIAITVWFWRSTRHDPELLGPLEVLGDRKFRRLDTAERRELLEASRPEEAKPMAWGVERGAAPSEPVVTASARAGDDIVLADAERVEAVAEAAVADAVAHSELDSILVAVGAVVPGAGAGDEQVESTAAATTDAPGATASTSADDGDDSEVGDGGAARAAVAGASAAAAASAGSGDGNGAKVAEPRAGDKRTPADANTSEPASTKIPADSAVQPLLIVPVDHDLRPSGGGGAEEPKRERGPAIVIGQPAEPLVADDDGAAEVADDFDRLDADEYVDDDATASIDPLLRSFNRNDG